MKFICLKGEQIISQPLEASKNQKAFWKIPNGGFLETGGDAEEFHKMETPLGYQPPLY